MYFELDSNDFSHFNKTYDYNTNKIINKNINIQNDYYMLYCLLDSFMKHLIKTLYDVNININILNINFNKNNFKIKFNNINKIKTNNRIYSINDIEKSN